MLVIPAIDIKNGRCVRLLQGDPDKETVYSDDPVAQAKLFQYMGAKLIHVVDLDGAFAGKVVHRDVIIEIAKTVDVPIEVGGGIRTSDDIKAYTDAGIKRIILGSSILDDTFGELIDNFMEFIIAGIDTKDGMVAVKGWKDVSSMSLEKAIQKVMSMGVNEIIHTDISSDGMLQGPNIESYKAILSSFPNMRLIASGGVSSMEDLRALDAAGVHGVISGKAIYDGRINLKQALKEF